MVPCKRPNTLAAILASGNARWRAVAEAVWLLRRLGTATERAAA